MKIGCLFIIPTTAAVLLFSLFCNATTSINANTTSSPPLLLQQRLPQALIIGAKKCGTRALLEFLRLNPNVAAPVKEVHFFDRHYKKGIEWYRSQMPVTREGQLTLEKSPGYFVNKQAPEHIHSMNHPMKLILVVRNPVTRAISDHTQALLRKHSTTTTTFEQLVTCSVNNTHCINGVNTSVGAIRIGIYHRHLRNWMNYFPLRQLLIVDGEKLVKDPASVLRSVEQFLELEPPVITANHFIKDAQKGFPCLRPINNNTGSGTRCLGKSKGRTHLPVSAQMIKRLEEFYRPENERFFQLINRRFNWF